MASNRSRFYCCGAAHVAFRCCMSLSSMALGPPCALKVKLHDVLLWVLCMHTEKSNYYCFNHKVHVKWRYLKLHWWLKKVVKQQYFIAIRFTTKFADTFYKKSETNKTKIPYVCKQCKLVKQQLILYILKYNKNGILFFTNVTNDYNKNSYVYKQRKSGQATINLLRIKLQ
jgi:hypothetical protein